MKRFSLSWWSNSSLSSTSVVLKGRLSLRKSFAIISTFFKAYSLLWNWFELEITWAFMLFIFMGNIVESPCLNIVLNSNIFNLKIFSKVFIFNHVLLIFTQVMTLRNESWNWISILSLHVRFHICWFSCLRKIVYLSQADNPRDCRIRRVGSSKAF